jgi:pantetheine-phosphate adenylyltransferase
VSQSPSPGLVVYPGTFDPVHYGHLDVMRRAADIFDRVIVAVYERPSKNIVFTTEERTAMVREAVADLPGIEVASYSGLTVEYAVTRGARAIIRGLRATSDFEFEFQIALMNRHLSPQIEALFLMTSLEHAHLSSSLIKEVAHLGGALGGLVPAHVAAALQRKRELA